ncbi:peptidyl-prolyl cis-trans isomerase CYP95-like [Tribolium madens]|uniref:peptidyl-prolyl cis-trans isomerase CYP95-like n=1 Tax=Tribolium madens TaxID=41895 RepID=UPI001CF76543|nr:peptidyl-prolyl cis-trans isomerase CYP95-like [Tribolium madens]
MLHRSTSSRRRRASRSTASSPQTRPSRSAGTSPGRRASIAVSPVDSERASRNTLAPEINRSPRHSIIPDISLDSQFPEHENLRSPRHSLAPDVLSPRNSLVPETSNLRSPRHSLVPNDTYSRSPRNSLVPDAALSPRNSLVPDSFNRSPRNSLIPESSRSPRHSIANLAPEFNRSPRNSLVPDSNRTPRTSLTPSESTIWHKEDKESNRSPRGSIAPESLCVRTSPRGSIAGEYVSDRSPRGSIGPESVGENRSPRGSIARSTLNAEDCGRSPRGSLTLTFQEPPANERRSSADNPSGSRSGGRSTSPYRSSSRGAVNAAYSGNSGFSESGSRRASSSVSQVSGDEQRRLCSDQKYGGDEPGLGLGISLTTYGSVAYQLKDANLEASGTCDFVCKALSIVNKTVVVTIVLVCLSTLPLLMLIMGDVGCVKMGLTLYSQLHTRRMDASSAANAASIGSRVASIALTGFLIIWFSFGNYWILRIKWPDYVPTLFEPNHWCHRTLYVFALVHLCVVYSVMGCVVVLMVVLAGCQMFGCPWLGPARYK